MPGDATAIAAAAATVAAGDQAVPKPLGRVKAVLFDMDGLMIDSEGIYTEVVNDVLRPYGKEQTYEIKSRLMGTPERLATEILLSSLWPPSPGSDDKIHPSCPFSVDNFIHDRNHQLLEAFTKVKPMPGAQRLVSHLAKHGVPICVATGSKRRNFEIKAKANEPLFAPFGPRVICGDDERLSRGKPSPDVFLLAAREGLGLGEATRGRVRRPGAEWDAGGLAGGEADFLVFEDAKPGVQAAKAAGMKVVWVPDPNIRAVVASSGEEAALGADEVLDSLLDFRPERWGLPAFD